MTSEKGDPSTVAGEFPSEIGGGGGGSVTKTAPLKVPADTATQVVTRGEDVEGNFLGGVYVVNDLFSSINSAGGVYDRNPILSAGNSVSTSFSGTFAAPANNMYSFTLTVSATSPSSTNMFIGADFYLYGYNTGNTTGNALLAGFAAPQNQNNFFRGKERMGLGVGGPGTPYTVASGQTFTTNLGEVGEKDNGQIAGGLNMYSRYTDRVVLAFNEQTVSFTGYFYAGAFTGSFQMNGNISLTPLLPQSQAPDVNVVQTPHST